MNPDPAGKKNEPASRRAFIRASSMLVAGGAVGGGLTLPATGRAFGREAIRIGLVGCGVRGAGAVRQALSTAESAAIEPNGPVSLVAMADLFPDRLQSAYRSLKGAYPHAVDVPPQRQFSGFGACRRLLDCDLDVVILATPPGFRPGQIEAAVAAGKHVLAEKPLAVDPAGIRRVLAAHEQARQRGLMLAVGLQRRHEPRYRETIARLQAGAIGDIVCLRVYWNGDGMWVRPRREGQTELEYQLRNWYYFTWLSGDHLVEQHVHNLDVGNWLLQGYPVECQGQGGRQVRRGPEFGEIYDHHFVEYTYANGAKMFSQCRQVRGCWNAVAEHAHGTRGHADISGAKIYGPHGELLWSGQGGGGGHQAEHDRLFAGLRRGEIYQEGDYGAYSTLTAIMGRMATYSGRKVAWEEALTSSLSLADCDGLSSLQDPAPTPPQVSLVEEAYPIASPGETS
jgi:predicted dehydrogenase